MPCTGWNHKHLTRRQPVADALDDKLEVPFKHADDLFVRMLVLWKCRAAVELHPRVRDTVAMYEAGAEAGKDLTHRQTIDLNERHLTTVH